MFNGYVDKLSKYTVSHNIDIKIVGVPKTIDNDLVGIDHSPGFGSAAKYIALASEKCCIRYKYLQYKKCSYY